MTAKRKIIWLMIGVIVVGFAAFALTRRQERVTQVGNADDTAAHSSHSSPTSPTQAKSVPAHYQTEPPVSSLAPTLGQDAAKGFVRQNIASQQSEINEMNAALDRLSR
jgi:hypothetical protein